MVIMPNHKTYSALVKAVQPACEERSNEALGFGDQDVINYCFSDWREKPGLHMSEQYNCLAFCLETVSKQFGFNNISIVHYVGKDKP